MRSHGRKMRCEQLLDDRRDSERLMSLVIKGSSLGELGPGDLQMLLLRLDREDEGVEKKGRAPNVANGFALLEHTSKTSV